MIRNLLLIFGSIAFLIVIGGATYEHAAVVPQWSTAVPASLSMFHGQYGIAPQNFWIPVHPVALSLLTAALIANWRTPRRKYIVTTLIGYAAILGATFVYFVPELMALTQSAYAATVDADLTRRAKTWELLSLIRLGLMLLLAVILLLGLTKTVEERIR